MEGLNDSLFFYASKSNLTGIMSPQKGDGPGEIKTTTTNVGVNKRSEGNERDAARLALSSFALSQTRTFPSRHQLWPKQLEWQERRTRLSSPIPSQRLTGGVRSEKTAILLFARTYRPCKRLRCDLRCFRRVTARLNVIPCFR